MSTSSAIRETQIKATRCHFTPAGMATMKNKTKQKTTSVGKDVKKLESSNIADQNVK